jgi:hypothetical protein
MDLGSAVAKLLRPKDFLGRFSFRAPLDGVESSTYLPQHPR